MHVPECKLAKMRSVKKDALDFKAITKQLYDFTKKQSDRNTNALSELVTESFDALDFRATTKQLYDFTKEQSNRNTNALPELVTEGFDTEQIWQQLELQNESELPHFSIKVAKVLAGNKKLIIPVSAEIPELTHIENDSVDENNETISERDDKESEDEDVEPKSILKKRKRDTKKRKKSSIVDDKFFKLQELDEYLTKEERKERHTQKANDAESDDESVDLFDDRSEEEDNNAPGKYLKYADFFDNPPSEDDQFERNNSENIEASEEEFSNGDEEMDDGTEEDEEEQEMPSKKVKFNLTNDSDETDSLENKIQFRKKDKEEDDTKPKSSLEMRQQRLLTRIKELEAEAITEKPWQLKGEVSGANRPQNSILEEFVEYDVIARPAPVITEETTIKLEDIIKQRIKNRAWDDVEKKFKPVETPLEYKKQLVMDQQKSKESLSQIYENEYLRQRKALNSEENEKEKEKEPELHREIKQMLRGLMSKLDALSNYHYTPKRVKPEIKILSHTPASKMEEVAPVGTSDAAVLAPEEVKAKSHGDLIAKSERTKTDKRRERRRKKMRQKAKQQVMEKKEKLNALKPGIAKKKKKEKAELLKKLTKNRNITKSVEVTHKVAKSSTAFFTKLQNEVKSQIKAKAGFTSKKKDKNALSALKLKL